MSLAVSRDSLGQEYGYRASSPMKEQVSLSLVGSHVEARAVNRSYLVQVWVCRALTIIYDQSSSLAWCVLAPCPLWNCRAPIVWRPAHVKASLGISA